MKNQSHAGPQRLIGLEPAMGGSPREGKRAFSLEDSCDRQKAASTLLVYAKFEPLHTLRAALASQGIDTWRARSCQQALKFLARFRPVHVIFTDTNLSDGTWVDLVRAMPGASAPVIVVARKMDTKLWSDTIRQGGSGLIAPPFAASDLTYLFDAQWQRVALTRAENHHRELAEDLFENEAWP
jgi:DNA-binding NtrC family response regulator